MSEISYQPKKDYKKYIFISLAVLFSLGVIIFLVLTVKQKNSDLKNSDDSANQQDSDKKVLSPEEIQKALTKTADDSTNGQEGDTKAISPEEIEKALTKTADDSTNGQNSDTKAISPEEIQASLNKRL